MERLPDISIFEFNSVKRKGGLPDIWEAHGLFVVSSRLLEILIEADAAAIVHKPIVMRDPTGQLLDDDHHFMDVVRNVKAIDYANSVIDYYGGSADPVSGRPSITVSFVSSRIVDGLDPQLKIFRQAGLYGGGRNCFVTQDLRERINSVSPPIRNIAFHPLYSLF